MRITEDEIRALPLVRVYIEESTNLGVWEGSERGYLEETPRGFTLHKLTRSGKLDGNRVFPLKGRTVTIYREGLEEEIIDPNWKR